MFDHPHLWEEIGYELKEGKLTGGENVVLRRTADTSPEFLETHSPIDDLIQFQRFATPREQRNWLVRQIASNLEHDELRHDDIVVINPNPMTTRSQTGGIRRDLLEMGVDSHLAGVDTDPDVFFQPEARSITFTGIYRAKGNEAGMVYIINAQDCASARGNLAQIRNRLFTAISRSKAWVRVLGIGSGMRQLEEEYQTLKRNSFELRFRYPTDEERAQLMIIHRDMTDEEQGAIESGERNLEGIVEDLEYGRIRVEDLPQDLVRRLRRFLVHEE